jgi:hypothetical protein
MVRVENFRQRRSASEGVVYNVGEGSCATRYEGSCYTMAA